MIGRFQGRDIIEKPKCPFCGKRIDAPVESGPETPYGMPVGRCHCGAVYAFDVTGHNQGTAMIDALVLGCNGEWDRAWDLLPERDYAERQIDNYDLETHLIVHGGVYEGRRIAGTLYFIRLHGQSCENPDGTLSQPGKIPEKLSKEKPTKKKARRTFSKRKIEALVSDYKLEEILALAREDKRIIRDLQRLLYSVDDRLRWRAADALGKVCGLICGEHPLTVSKLLQGLFSSLTDTAASSWGAIDAIGEIIRNSPAQFSGYLPQVYQLTRDRTLLAGVLRALARVGEKSPELLRGATHRFVMLLKDADPEVRGYAAAILGHLGAEEAKDELNPLVTDSAPVAFYMDGQIENRTVGQLVSESLSKL